MVHHLVVGNVNYRLKCIVLECVWGFVSKEL
jgi:hypothetical protein